MSRWALNAMFVWQGQMILSLPCSLEFMNNQRGKILGLQDVIVEACMVDRAGPIWLEHLLCLNEIVPRWLVILILTSWSWLLLGTCGGKGDKLSPGNTFKPQVIRHGHHCFDLNYERASTRSCSVRYHGWERPLKYYVNLMWMRLLTRTRNMELLDLSFLMVADFYCRNNLVNQSSIWRWHDWSLCYSSWSYPCASYGLQ